MSDPTYSRRTDLVWRSGPDRILLHRVDGPAETASTELSGPVAFVWLALDEPATVEQLISRLAEADITVADLEDDLTQLVEARLVSHSRVGESSTVNEGIES